MFIRRKGLISSQWIEMPTVSRVAARHPCSNDPNRSDDNQPGRQQRATDMLFAGPKNRCHSNRSNRSIFGWVTTMSFWGKSIKGSSIDCAILCSMDVVHLQGIDGHIISKLWVYIYILLYIHTYILNHIYIYIYYIGGVIPHLVFDCIHNSVDSSILLLKTAESGRIRLCLKYGTSTSQWNNDDGIIMYHPPWPNIHKAIWFQRTICKAWFRIKMYRNLPDATPTRLKKGVQKNPKSISIADSSGSLVWISWSTGIWKPCTWTRETDMAPWEWGIVMEVWFMVVVYIYI